MIRGTGEPTNAVHLWVSLWRDLDRSERVRLGIAAGATIIASVATALTPSLVGLFVNEVYREGRLVGLEDAWIPLALLAVTAIVIGATGIVRHQQIHTVTTAFTAKTRQRIYAALLRWDLGTYIDDAKGAIYGRANRGVEGAERLIKLGAGDVLPAVLVTVFGVTVAFIQFGWLGFAILAVVPAGFGLVVWQVHSQNGIRVQVAGAKEKIDGAVSSWLGGIDVIRTLGVERFFDAQIADDTGTLMKRERRHHIAMSLFDALKLVNETIWLLVTLVLAIMFGALTSAGAFAGLVLLYFAVTRPLRELHRVIDEASEAALLTRMLTADLAVAHDRSFEDVPGPISSAPTANAVVLRNVTFQHAGALEPVLRGITTSIRVGERVGIVGASGCGKSTLLKIIARLMHGYTGDITVAGRDLTGISRNALVQEVGYVGQRATLFQGTIRDNLLLGRDGIDDVDLRLACARANIHDEIDRMPLGFDTVIGEEGSRLSGGQSQRLCLARALVNTPPLMLLDEPTSALDAPSQTVVQQAIDSLDGLTMIVVAHRLSTLRTMDRILVMSEGVVVEEGGYDDLSTRGGLFARMLDGEQSAA
jgi:ABC-type multidrug transport system fused ATPase/permease subunit